MGSNNESKDFPTIFKESVGREFYNGVESIHGTELIALYKNIRENELLDTSARLAVVMQDINDNPDKTQEILGKWMADIWNDIHQSQQKGE